MLFISLKRFLWGSFLLVFFLDLEKIELSRKDFILHLEEILSKTIFSLKLDIEGNELVLGMNWSHKKCFETTIRHKNCTVLM